MFASKAALYAHTFASLECSLYKVAFYAKKMTWATVENGLLLLSHVGDELREENLVTVSPFGLRELRVSY